MIGLGTFSVVILFNVGACDIISRSYDIGPVVEPTKCPGLFCGRIKLENETYSKCSACPWGSRPSGVSICKVCDEALSLYDSLYLCLMAVIPLILHWFFIDYSAKRRNFTREVLFLHASAWFEAVAAAIITILAIEPYGEFTIKSCSVKQLSDWYTLLHNPSPGYVVTLHCTQEAVYPLYTMVFLYYTVSLIFMLFIRLLIVHWITPGKGKNSIYTALYFIPFLMVIHGLFAGLIYYSYPYLVLILSVCSSAAHFAFRINQSMKSLLRTTFTDIRNIIILLGHWIFHAFGIIALTELKILNFHGPMLLTVPIPAIFYIITSRFTNPEYATSNLQ